MRLGVRIGRAEAQRSGAAHRTSRFDGCRFHGQQRVVQALVHSLEHHVHHDGGMAGELVRHVRLAEREHQRIAERRVRVAGPFADAHGDAAGGVAFGQGLRQRRGEQQLAGGGLHRRDLDGVVGREAAGAGKVEEDVVVRVGGCAPQREGHGLQRPRRAGVGGDAQAVDILRRRRHRQRPGGVRRKGGFALPGDAAAAVHRVVEPAAVAAAQQHVGASVAVHVADADDGGRRVGGQVRRASPGTHGAAVQRIEVPAPVLVAQQHVVAPVAVEVADARHLPGEVRRHAGDRAAAGNRGSPVHGVEVPAAVLVAQQHVVAPVAVEVADAGNRPGEGRRNGRRAAAGEGAAAVHAVVVPAPLFVAQQHVVLAVAVEVADAGHLPGEVRSQVRRAAAGEHGAAVHRVEVPAAVVVAQQHVVLPIAVEIADASDSPSQVPREVRGAVAGEHPVAVHRVVVPTPVRVAEQHVVPAVAVEVAEAAQMRPLAHLLLVFLQRQAKRVAAGGVPGGPDPQVVGARIQPALNAEVLPRAGVVVERQLIAASVVEPSQGVQPAGGFHRHLATGGRFEAEPVRVVAGVDDAGGLARQRHAGGLADGVAVVVRSGTVVAGVESQAERVAAGAVPEGLHLDVVGTRVQLALDAEVHPRAGVVVEREPGAVRAVERTHGVQAAGGLRRRLAAGGDLEPEPVRVVAGVDDAGGLARQRDAGGRGEGVAVVVRSGAVVAGLESQAERVAAGVVPEGLHLDVVGSRVQLALNAEVQTPGGVVVEREPGAGRIVERAHGVQPAGGLRRRLAGGWDLEPEPVRIVAGVDDAGGLARQRHAGGRGEGVAVVVRLAEGGLLLEVPSSREAAGAVVRPRTVPLVDSGVQPVGAGRGFAEGAAEPDSGRAAGIELDRLAVGYPPQPQEDVAVRVAVLHVQQVVAPPAVRVLGRHDAEEEIAGGLAVVVVDDHQVAHFHVGADGHRAGGDGQPRAPSLAVAPVVVGAGRLADGQCAGHERKADEVR